MSSNRLSYDACAYQKTLQESTGPLDYMMYTGKFENCAKCRIEFGVVGGNGVSLFSGNLVDLESDLRGQTRMASSCPSTFYNPENSQGKQKMMHQPSCQMQYYPKSPMPVPVKPSTCNYNRVEHFIGGMPRYMTEDKGMSEDKGMRERMYRDMQSKGMHGDMQEGMHNGMQSEEMQRGMQRGMRRSMQSEEMERGMRNGTM